MDQPANYLPYQSTGYFSRIVSDYLQQSALLQPFYLHAPNLEGIKNAIIARKHFNTPRNLLVEVLQKQYTGLTVSEKIKQNILALADANTFTITTAHQPNIFTGPLYFIYKIMHAIKLADELSALLPDNKFVPVYYMGSEDADLAELGFINAGGQKLVWETNQKGAVGRMKVDKALIKLINEIHGQVGVLPYGNELIELFTSSYTEGKTIQQATLELVNELFSNHGIVILIPDNGQLKQAFQPVVERELVESFSHKIVEATIKNLEQHYKVQAGGREINLFYLIDDKRERIELQGTNYEVRSLGLNFSKVEILAELKSHPERFSANVILRGAFQETVLPNVAFIGGGGELAYWLELKEVFAAVGIPYPVLLLRNSFLLVKKEQAAKLRKLGISDADLFKDELTLLNTLVKRESDLQLSLDSEMEQAHNYYIQLQKITDAVDITLSEHVIALEKQALKKLNALQKKLLRAERTKYETQKKQIAKLKQELFPDGSLQERVDNLSVYYAVYGKEFLQKIYNASRGISEGFGITAI